MTKIEQVIDCITKRGEGTVADVMQDCNLTYETGRRIIQKGVASGRLQVVRKEVSPIGRPRTVYGPCDGAPDFAWKGERVSSVWDLGAMNDSTNRRAA